VQSTFQPQQEPPDVPLAIAKGYRRSGERIARVVARLTATNILMTAFGAVTGPLLARALGPGGRGTLAAIVVPLTLLPWVLSFGLPNFAARESARGRRLGLLLPCIGVPALALGLIGAAVAYPLASSLAHGREVVFTYLVIGLFLLPIALVENILNATAAGLERWNLLIVARLLGPLISLIMTCILFAFGDLTVATAAIVALITGAASLAPVSVLLRNIRPLQFDLRLAVEGLRFGVKSWVGNMGYLANQQLDQFLMILLVPARQLGLYAVAVSVAGIGGWLTGGVNTVLLPRVAQGQEHLVAQAARVTLAIVGIANFAFAMTIPLLVPALFGSRFAGAVPMVWILLIAAVPNQGGHVLSAALTGAGRPGVPASAEIVGLLVTLPTLLALLGPLGGIGAAIASLVAYTVRFSILLSASKRLFQGSVREFVLVSSADRHWARSLIRGAFSGFSNSGSKTAP
jgi:O-antigen/teichoic acid export membrane protein